MKIKGEKKEKLSEVARCFIDGKQKKESKFVIVTGGVGAGKTTLIENKYSEDFLHFDAELIEKKVKEKFNFKSKEFHRFVLLAGGLILQQVLRSNRNIVIEVIGNDKDKLEKLIKLIENAGYRVLVEYVEADPREAYERHLKAVEEDSEYKSAYYTQDQTIFMVEKFFEI